MLTFPADWKEVSLLECVDLLQGLTYKPENVKTHGILVLRSSNIQNGGLSFKDCVHVDSYVPANIMVRKGDILICVRNGSSELIGKSCVLPALDNTTFGAFMSVLRGDKTGYISKVFASRIIQEQIKNRSSATINQITKKDFQSIRIYIPQLESEQKEIAETLTVFDTHIANLTELIEKKKAIREGALEDLISGRTRIEGFNGEWETVSFNDYFSILSNNTYAREKLAERGEIGNIHYGDILVKYSDIVTNHDSIPFLRPEVSYSDSWLLQTNDIIIADTAEDETVGKAIQIGEISFPIVGGLHTIVCRPKHETATGFLGYYINSKCFHDQLLSHITGIKVSSISKKAIKTTELHIPKEKEEQAAIVRILSAMDDEIHSLEVERDKIKQIREGAMDDLLTGKVRLTD